MDHGSGRLGYMYTRLRDLRDWSKVYDDNAPILKSPFTKPVKSITR